METRPLDIQEHEALAAADREHSSGVARAAFMLDTSSCAAALAVYAENGKPQICGLWSYEVGLLPRVEELLPNGYDAEEVKNAVRRYYLSDRELDVRLGGGQTVSALVRMCEEVAQTPLEAVFASADRILSELGIGITETDVLLYGGLASFFPLEAMVRCHFSPAMPMMPDDRYRHYPDVMSVVDEGRAILERYAVRLVAESVIWQLTCTEGVRSVYIALPNTEVTALEKAVYADSGEVFVCAGDTLTVDIGKRRVELTVPEEILSDKVGVVELGIEYTNESFCLLLRNSRTGAEHRYTVDIPTKGDR